jgi:hypothetical protein
MKPVVIKIPLITAQKIDHWAACEARFRHDIAVALLDKNLRLLRQRLDRNEPVKLPVLPPTPRCKTRSLTVFIPSDQNDTLDKLTVHCGLSRHQTILRILIPAVESNLTHVVNE